MLEKLRSSVTASLLFIMELISSYRAVLSAARSLGAKKWVAIFILFVLVLKKSYGFLRLVYLFSKQKT